MDPETAGLLTIVGVILMAAGVIGFINAIANACLGEDSDDFDDKGDCL